MKGKLISCTVIIAAMMPNVALADDPNDPTMRSAAARARDRAIIRQLNVQELERVRRRDARYAQHKRAASKAYAARKQVYTDRLHDHEIAKADYARNRAKYERDMAEWRRAVAACRAGDRAACN